MRVVVNAAMSADGKLSSRRREPVRISGPEDFDRMDRLRAESDAIMVGVGTVLADDPSLTVKNTTADPTRVVADSNARTPPDAAVLDGAPDTTLLVAESAPRVRVDALEAAGATIVEAGRDRVDLANAFAHLEATGIDQVMVEGGGELLYSLFAADLVDELSVYVGAMIIGGRDAPTLVDGAGFADAFPSLSLTDVERLDDGVVLYWTVD